MRPAFGVLLTVVGIVSCSELFGDAVQCSSDDDCAKFSAVCNVAEGVCSKDKGGDLPNRDGGTLNDPPPGPSKDAASPSPPPIVDDKCKVAQKPTGVIGTKIAGVEGRAEITAATTLGCDKDWTLDTLVFVRSGATLTIAPSTTIRAKKGVNAGIVVSKGGRIVAEGQKDLPIVFTSDAAAPVAGDWRGIYVLGQAPPGLYPPYDDDPDLPYGGANEADDSGVLSFARIEYARVGLVFAGVGRKTKVDFVQVRQSIENCFMFKGGRVDVKHLVCQSPGDDQFEWWAEHEGRAQFLYGQKSAPPPVFGADGILVDGSKAVIFNATICGDKATALNGYGVRFRDEATINLNNAIVTGWFAGLDASGTLATPGEIKSSIVFGNATNPAWVEDSIENQDLPDFDDDNGYDEIAEFNTEGRANSTTNPSVPDCFDPKTPKAQPTTALTVGSQTPPNDGFFDVNAAYVGAFKDQGDSWMTGAWVRFDDK